MQFTPEVEARVLASSYGHLNELCRLSDCMSRDLRSQANYLGTMTKFARALAWLLLVALIFVTVCPIEYRPHPRGFPVTIERLGAFGLLGLLFAVGYPSRRWQICALIVIAAGVLEASQMLDPSRHGRLADFAVKALGGALGVASASVIDRISTRPARARA
jgi:hypothetical protein